MSTTRETAIAAASEALAIIPVAEFKARQDERAAKLRHIEETISSTEAKLQEVNRDIEKIEQRGADTAAAAAALLAGADVLEIDDLPRLQARQAGLRAGLQGLRAQLNSSTEAPGRVLQEVRGAVGEAVAPLAELLTDEARDAAERLARTFADISATANASTNGAIVSLQRSLSPVIAELGRTPLLDAVPIEPSPDLANAFDVHADALRTARLAFPESVPFPRPEVDIGAGLGVWALREAASRGSERSAG